MTGLVQYRAIGLRGEQILNALESETGYSGRRKWSGVREFEVPVSGEADLDHVLARIDAAWEQHVERVTPR